MNIISSFSHKNQEPENKVLYVVGTPIGNLDDISFRALNILENVSLIACEDTRQTKKIMNKFQIKNTLISFNQHNSLKKIPKIIDALKAGKSVALVSDAGLPTICDPGEDLIKETKVNGFKTICIPGPCAALTALASSGLPSSKFIFFGFLPKKKSDREVILEEISKCEKTSILYESPRRLKTLLIELKSYCEPDREIQIFRELTKRFEESVGKNLEMIIDFFEDKEVIGEITIVIGGIRFENSLKFDETELKKELNNLKKAGLSLSAASKYLAKKNNIPKNLIYNLY